jgi:hypothetical protein
MRSSTRRDVDRAPIEDVVQPIVVDKRGEPSLLPVVPASSVEAAAEVMETEPDLGSGDGVREAGRARARGDEDGGAQLARIEVRVQTEGCDDQHRAVHTPQLKRDTWDAVRQRCATRS